MRNSLRTLLIGIALIAALGAAPTALADHAPYAHLTDELLLPHELTAAIAPTPPLAFPTRQLMAGEAGTDEPDLYPVLPTDPIGGTPAVFVDIYEEPGKLLFRFDSVIANRGGTLQMYCQDCTSSTDQKVWQIIWPGGRPPADDIPDPDTIPSNTQLAQDLLPSGAVMLYSARSGHHHCHYDFAAWYELIIPGQANRRDNKVGFCMYDTYGGTGEAYFPGGQDNGWCRFMEPNADFAHMGISPDHGDMYNAQLADQWIDVTDLPPGEYTLEATVNPQNTIIESDTTNNVLSVTRTIPGATATPTIATTPLDTAAAIALGGTIVGHDIPSIFDNCSVWDPNCYETASSSALTYDVENEPDHGTVTIAGNGLTATATYTPDPGHIGPDAFTYTTTDSRDLKSLPATVTITVGGGTPSPPAADATFATTDEQVAVNVDLSGSDSETCELTFSIVDPPAHGSLEQIADAACSAGNPNTDSASVVYTPTVGHVGSDSFTYKINDGTADSAPATATIDTAENPEPLVTNPGAQTDTEGDTVSLQIVATDTDSLDYDAVGLPPGLSISSADGLISGTIGASGAGSYTVTITVDDGISAVDIDFDWTVTDTPGTCGPLAQEAENATLFGDFAIGTDAAASNGQYVAYSGGAIWGSPDTSQRVSFCVTITTPGTYQINTNVYAANGSSDSFYVDIDNDPTTASLWDVLQNTSYAQDPVSHRGGADPVQITLTAGEHTLDIYAREPGTRLDTIELALVAP